MMEADGDDKISERAAPMDGLSAGPSVASADAMRSSYTKQRLLSLDDELRLGLAAAAGDEAAKWKIVEANLRLVMSIAKNKSRPGYPFEDVVQDGIWGLTRAAEKYDARLGYKFSTYATWWINQAISRSVAVSSRSIRFPVHIHEKVMRLRATRRALERKGGDVASADVVAAKAELHVDEIRKLDDLPHATPIVDLEAAESASALALLECVDGTPERVADDYLLEHFEQLLDHFSEREQLVLRSRLGLRGNVQTLDEIGLTLGVTRERVRQIESKALARLRPAFRVLLGREPDPDEPLGLEMQYLVTPIASKRALADHDRRLGQEYALEHIDIRQAATQLGLTYADVKRLISGSIVAGSLKDGWISGSGLRRLGDAEARAHAERLRPPKGRPRNDPPAGRGGKRTNTPPRRANRSTPRAPVSPARSGSHIAPNAKTPTVISFELASIALTLDQGEIERLVRDGLVAGSCKSKTVQLDELSAFLDRDQERGGKIARVRFDAPMSIESAAEVLGNQPQTIKVYIAKGLLQSVDGQPHLVTAQSVRHRLNYIKERERTRLEEEKRWASEHVTHEETMTFEEVAAVLRVAPQSVPALATKGLLDRVSGTKLITAASVNRRVAYLTERAKSGDGRSRARLFELDETLTLDIESAISDPDSTSMGKLIESKAASRDIAAHGEPEKFDPKAACRAAVDLIQERGALSTDSLLRLLSIDAINAEAVETELVRVSSLVRSPRTGEWKSLD